MPNLNGFLRLFYNFGNWLAKMMYLHVLWLSFTLLGLGIFGVVPATMATVYIIHKWFAEGYDIPIMKHFWTFYKANFLKANGLGLLWAIIGLFLYADYYISKQFIQSFYFHSFLIILIVLFIVSLFHFHTIYTRYDLKFFQYFKQSLFIGLARPVESIAMLITLVPMYYLYNILPILLVFMGASLSLYPIVWFSYRACLLVEVKRERIQNEASVHYN
ncbi:YesL family protein [Gracilibacillus sp. HCP3S3_G5_1]|uniref:YesL family protein n=1 Tax=unclassified Gracilibacillus TaxID=2625209 RepID=UPI003F88FD4C